MAVTDTDLLLVQRGTVAYKTTADKIAEYSNSKINLGDGGDVPIASAVQLGVIKVGSNLDITGDGTLSAVIPAGVEYMGTYGDLNNPPAATVSGQFWIWNGGDGTLNNAGWGTPNGSTVSDNDRLLYDGTSFDLLPAGAGGGLTQVTGTAPISVTAVNDGSQDVSIQEATTGQDGYMTSAAFTKLDGLEAGAQVNVDPTQSYAAAPTNGLLTLQPGGDTTAIPAANGTNAGLMAATEFNKLDGIEAGAEVNVNPSQAYTPAASSGQLTLTPGGDATTIPAANGTAAGLMTSAMFTKLDSVETGAEANISPSQTLAVTGTTATLTMQPGGDTTVISGATSTEAGLLTAADKAVLDNLVASPGGVLSLVAGNGITVNTATAPGSAGTPEVLVKFAGTGADETTTVLPSNLLLLGDLPT